MVAGLVGVLATLGTLQNRWITQLSNTEGERLRGGMEKAAAQVCDGFDRELTRAWQSFRLEDGAAGGDLAATLSTRLARWRTTAAEAALVQELLVVTRLGGGVVSLSRLDEPTGHVLRAEWSPELASVRQIFAERGPVPLLDELLPGLILPVRDGLLPGAPGARGEGERRPPRDHVIVRLDRAYVTQQFLPRLARSAFGSGDDLAYHVVVRVADRPEQVLLGLGPTSEGARPARAELERRLFSLRFFPELAKAGESGAAPRRAPAPPPRRADDRGEPAEGGSDRRDLPRREGVEEGRWVLEVRHPAGSLEAVVASTRRRNLAISLATVGLLGTVAVLMMVSTRRAHRLARQQMDFVASVSHELRTPLTAMRSAGQNLADGIVADPERVRSYGALIEREGRRLTEMVARVLAFAGIRSGQQSYRMETLDALAVVEGVLADSRWVLEEKRIAVDASLPAELPAIRGDAAALRQALSNLIDNAMKYGAAAGRIGVRVEAVTTSRGEEVAIAVSDRGPGIRRSDLGHVFEPFFRGGDPDTAAAPGSGLGLAVVKGVVEAHGGRVTVETAPGRGSTFTIHLPAAIGEGRPG